MTSDSYPSYRTLQAQREAFWTKVTNVILVLGLVLAGVFWLAAWSMRK